MVDGRRPVYISYSMVDVFCFISRFSRDVMLKNVELRKLKVGSLCNISRILETNDDWKKVMSFIPRDPRSEKFEPKYNNEHIKLIEDHARCTNRLGADVLFEEWGTSGRVRPTLETLKTVLKRAQIFRAADEVAAMLQEEPPTRPVSGPGAPVDTNITLMLQHQASDRALGGTTAQLRSHSKHATPSLGNKTTLEMKSDSDLLKFSTRSLNVPDLTALGIQSHSSIKPDEYQTSLPNIDLTDTCLDSDILTDETLTHFEYHQLQAMTKNFADKVSYTPDSTGGGKLAGKIGSGGFGEVFVGYHPKFGHLAIKRALYINIKKLGNNPDFVKDSFNKEVRFLSRFRHKNIVSIIGIAVDGPSLCLVCEYIGGGSLEKKIDEKILTEKQRIDIMIGTAEGLRYLHESNTPGDSSEVCPLEGDKSDSTSKKKNNFVHGDVKSANILLTSDFVPKVCDFGISKQYDSTVVDVGVMGTFAYMSPEALKGTITQKLDIFSYGIVLLELLTGFKAIVQKNERETINIKEYIEETCPEDISVVLDPFVMKWRRADQIYLLATKCLVKDRHKRPSAEQVCEMLYSIDRGDFSQPRSGIDFTSS